MGVIRRTNESTLRIEDCDGAYREYDLTESDTESTMSVRIAASRTQRKKEYRESRRLRRFHDALGTDGVAVQRHMGARKWRRVENARALLAMIDSRDIVDDFSDILEQTTTAFGMLLADKNKMAVWNEFIARDEAEQHELLAQYTREQRQQQPPGRWTTNAETWFVVGGSREHVEKKRDDFASEESDKRRHHPAFSASSCFARMDGKLRGFLSERNLPWALIDRVESELRDFFVSTPEEIWSRSLPNPRSRLTVHAIASFLMLKSRTKAGELVEVSNARSLFIPPQSLLIPYLATRRRAPIHFVPCRVWPEDGEAPADTRLVRVDADVSDSSSANTSLEIIEEEDLV